MSQKEELFNDKLKDIFIGEEIKGKSGYANLMRIKSNYFDEVFQQLNEDIDKRVSQFDDEKEFREELYSKLYTFMKKYFSDSGSIYFTYTPLNEKTYEEVYDNNEDVTLFWKTHMLYYVKTDTIWNELEIENKELDGEEYDIHFDVSEMEGKDANEKTKIKVFLEEVEDDQIELSVEYHSHGMSNTAINDIRKGLKKEDIKISNEKVRDIVGTFRKQNEVDFFINKDPEGFLKEQFDMWLKQYVLDENSVFKEDRLQEIKAIRDTAYDIIDFVSQFEEELKKIWNKPKFALNSNYVITLDKIMEQEDGKEVIEKLQEHGGWEDQVEEWKEQEMLEEEPGELFKTTVNAEKALKDNYEFLPVDTKHFSDLKLDIIQLFDSLDASLDGWLINSENYQAINTISSRFKEDIQTVYIDPPFNKEDKANYDYRVKFKDSTWITMLENRIKPTKQLMRDSSSIFVRCDYNGNAYVKMLMDDLFGGDKFQNEIKLRKSAKLTEKITRYHSAHDSLYFYSKTDEYDFEPVTEKRENPTWRPMHLPGIRWSPIPDQYVDDFSEENLKQDEDDTYRSKARIIKGKEMLPPEGRHWALSQESIKEYEDEGRIRLNDDGKPRTKQPDRKTLTDNWTDAVGYSSNWDFTTENHELVIKRALVTSCSEEEGLVMDYYLGSGTTTAVAQKLGKRWIGVEMGDHFYDTVLPRMKKVLNYDKSGISKKKDVKKKYNRDSAGGFFKYYELEQYEQALKKCTYEDSKPFDFQSEKVYNEYVFLNDDKMLDVVDVDREDEEVSIDLTEIYPNVDIAETLSNVKGKKIKQIKENSVEFVDGELVEFDKIEFKNAKSLIWWD